MADRSGPGRAAPGSSLPAFERLAPATPLNVLADEIDARTLPGDLVLDLHGRGGWVARAAIDQQRRAITIESNPLTRLLAEVVLRPPDLRHLDAAFGAIAAAPRGDTSLKLAIGDMYATRCPTCLRNLVADELIWELPTADPDGWPRPIRRHWRCAVCRDQQGGGEHRQAPLDDDDLARALVEPGAIGAERPRSLLAERFPVLDGGDGLVAELLDLHTPRQIVGLAGILERIDADLRAAPVEAALRIALLHALLPASRLNAHPGRVGSLRVSNGHVRVPPASQWRERNPWLAFEDGYRLVRTFVARLETGASGPLQARFGDDIRAIQDGPSSVSVRLATPSTYRGLGEEATDLANAGQRSRVRLVLGQPPARPSLDRLALAYYATGWLLGREAASLLPLEPLFGPAPRVPWSWQSAALRRTLEAAEPLIARDGRVVLLVEGGGPDPLVASALGGSAAGYRVVSARLAEPGEETGARIELVPPSGVLPPSARTRGNVPLSAIPGGLGDPDLVPGRGLFAPPERIDARPFALVDAQRQVSETAVEVLKIRGEPARTEQLFGQILVGLDRSGLLRRFVGGDGAAGAEHAEMTDPDASDVPGADTPGRDPGGVAHPTSGHRPSQAGEEPGTSPRSPAETSRRTAPERGAEHRHAPDQVERFVALVTDELARSGGRRLTEVAPGRWWLADRADRESASAPLSDRVEWAAYSLLSTAGPLSEAQFYERISTLFAGPDLPDEALVRAALESYRSMASTPDRLVTGDDLLRRTHEHAELIALLAETGHALGLSVWLSPREQERRLAGRPLGDLLEDRERRVWLPSIARAPVDALEEVDAIWYSRGRLAFMFEVEWTAMLGEPILRRHERIPGHESIVRFLVLLPERTELARFKLERSPLLQAAFEAQNWHVLKANHLRAFAALEPPSLDALEPFLGLDPLVERTGDQLPLFGG
jgi:hypothetical protein